MDASVEVEPKGLSSQDAASPTCRMGVRPRGGWDLGMRLGKAEAPLPIPRALGTPA